MVRKNIFGTFLLLLIVAMVVIACGNSAPAAVVEQKSSANEAGNAETEATDKTEQAEATDKAEAAVPDWFNIELTNVNSGETFKVADFQGKVILIETMAVWCPSCTRQQEEVQALHDMLGERDDFVSLSLDVDPNESGDILKAHATDNGFDWYFAVTPTEMTRAFGRLYSAQYVNPPVNPMMIIDRQGEVYALPFGGTKKAQNLRNTLDSFLNGG